MSKRHPSTQPPPKLPPPGNNFLCKAMRYKLSIGCFSFSSFRHFLYRNQKVKSFENRTSVLVSVMQNLPIITRKTNFGNYGTKVLIITAINT